MRDLVAPVAIAIIGIVIFFLVHPIQKFFFVPAMIVALVCYIAYCLFLLAGLWMYIEMYKGMNWAMILVWFFVSAGVLGNAVLHPLLAVRVGGYYPGLYTSFAYWILGPILFMRLWETRK